MAKLVDISEAVALVPDRTSIGVGGVLLNRKPMAFLWALVDAGVRDLVTYSFLASLDIELLAAHGMVTEAHTGYVGFEQLGFAPAFEEAVDAGRVRVSEYTELLYVTGLRAAAAGLPFLPTKGGMGSAIATELNMKEIADPYSGEQVIAVPALKPDVAVIHVEAADHEGNVLGPTDRDFLFDADATLARAATKAIVTAEEIVDGDYIRSQNRRTMLYGYEIAAVVHMPNGARPTALPGAYRTDTERISRYIEEAGTDPAKAAISIGALR